MSFFYDFFITDNKSGHKTKETHLLNKYPDVHKKIYEFCDNDFLLNLSFKEKIWHLIHDNKTQVKCRECSEPLKFKRSIQEGYGKYCSIECTNKNLDHINTVKSTNTVKYGGVSPIHSNSIKNKIKTTNQIRYGVDNNFQRVDLIKEKLLEKYGVDNPSKSREFLEKTKETNFIKHGVTTNLLLKDSLLKSYRIRKEKYLEKYSDYNFITHTGNTLTIICPTCGLDYNIDRSLFRFRDWYSVNPCTKCNPINKSVSYLEQEIFEYVSSLISVSVMSNDRKILDGKELDIFIPEHNIAIEFNGLFWHSESRVGKNYHRDKTIMCGLKNIKLIHVFEDEWLYKKGIVKSIIKNSLGLTDHKIYARKCSIKELSSDEYKTFTNENHIQGYVKSKIKLGLFYGDELISVMSFGGLRRSLGHNSKEGSYEMLRFCNKLGYSVIGGASKLLNFFIKKYEPKSIISYSDNRYFSGDLYGNLGFTYLSDTKPNYFYFMKNCVREHRFKYRKDVLVNDGFDQLKTEREIMTERGYSRIYDCGNKKWLWKAD